MTLGVNLRKNHQLSPKIHLLNQQLPLRIVGAAIRNRPQEEAKDAEKADSKVDAEMAALGADVEKIADSEVAAAMIEEVIEAVVVMITSEEEAAANTKRTTLTLEEGVGAIVAVEAAVSTATTTTAKVVVDIAAVSTTQKDGEVAEEETVDSEGVEADRTSTLTMTTTSTEEEIVA